MNIIRKIENKTEILEKKNIFYISGIIAIAVLVIVFFIYEYIESRSELLQTIDESSVTLIESMNISIENSFLANNEIENLLVQRLNAAAAYIGEFDNNNKKLSHEILQKACDDFEINLIIFINRDGTVAYSNIDSAITINDDFLLEIEPVLKGDMLWLDLGVINSPFNDSSMYFLVRNRQNNAGIIAAGYEMKKIADFRKRIGIGKQIKDIGDNPDIEYIALQDDDGILSASQKVDSLSSISADTLLASAILSYNTYKRVIEYNNKNIFEVIKSIHLDDGSVMINRIGLSLENFDRIIDNSFRRILVITIATLLVAVFLIIFVVIRQRLYLLREEHKKIQSYNENILENMADSVVVVDKKGIITIFNKAAEIFFNIESNAALYHLYLDVFPTDDLSISRVFSELKPYISFESELRSDQVRKEFAVSVSLVFSGDGLPESAIAVIKDLTEENRIRRELERREKISAMGALAAGVAHEIRNPLNAIHVITQRFLFEFEPREDVDEYKRLAFAVRAEVTRVNSIIKQFLDFARPAKLNPALTSLNTIINETIDLISSQSKALYIDIECIFRDNIILYIDKEKIKQALINLMQNSIESMPNGGKLLIHLYIENHQAILKIQDTGSGIPTEDQTKIFNLYFTTKSSGTGLGLSIVHQIITEHDGTITCESLSNKGTTMIITLPI